MVTARQRRYPANNTTAAAVPFPRSPSRVCIPRDDLHFIRQYDGNEARLIIKRSAISAVTSTASPQHHSAARACARVIEIGMATASGGSVAGQLAAHTFWSVVNALNVFSAWQFAASVVVRQICHRSVAGGTQLKGDYSLQWNSGWNCKDTLDVGAAEMSGGRRLFRDIWGCIS